MAFSLKDRKKSFRDAFRGVASVARSQINFRIHLVILAAVIVAALILRISLQGWIAIIIASGVVLAAECLNSAIELLCDAVSPEEHPLIGRAKDAAAGAVLIASVAAAAVGVAVLLPPLLDIMGKTG